MLLYPENPRPDLEKDLPILVKGRVTGLSQGKGGEFAFIRVEKSRDWKHSLKPSTRRLTRDITISLEPTIWFGPAPEKGSLVLVTKLSNLFSASTKDPGLEVERWRAGLGRLWRERDQRFFIAKKPPKDWPVFTNQPLTSKLFWPLIWLWQSFISILQLLKRRKT